MTQDEIIRMAREAEFWKGTNGLWMCDTNDLERFAALVAAHEREKQAEQEPVEKSYYIEGVEHGFKKGVERCAELIESGEFGIGNMMSMHDDASVAEALRELHTALRESLAEKAEQEPVHVENIYKSGDKYFAWIGDDYVQIYTAPVRTKDLTYAELGELFVKAKEETFGYARVKPEGGISLKPSIEYFARAVIAADREKNK